MMRDSALVCPLLQYLEVDLRAMNVVAICMSRTFSISLFKTKQFDA